MIEENRICNPGYYNWSNQKLPKHLLKKKKKNKTKEFGGNLKKRKELEAIKNIILI